MNTRALVLIAISSVLFGLGAWSRAGLGADARKEQGRMELGGFSVSLTVKDLAKSRAFYETLGFSAVSGQESDHYLIMRSGTTNIGLFQGMFEENILTFNPGWTNTGEELESFQDVREIQGELKKAGVELLLEADPASDGPAHIVFTDPDGNQILIDQHVGKPKG